MSSLFLPKRIRERLIEESIDPESKAEVHLTLSDKYMKEAEEYLNKGDYVQASEKAWGAASQMVKAVAAKKGKDLKSHSELHSFVLTLKNEVKDPELRRLWQAATSLHQNFYENWLPADFVRESIEDVKEFIKRIKKSCGK